MPSASPLPPRLRSDPLHGFYAVVPGTWWGVSRFQYFPTETAARAWAARLWCRRHRRRDCPPIVREQLLQGNLRDPAFRTWYASTFHSGIRTRFVVDGQIRTALAYGIIPTDTPAHIPTDAWNARALARANPPVSSAWEPWQDPQGVAPDPEVWNRTPDDARPDYAGLLDEDGTVPRPTRLRVVFACYGVDRHAPLPDATDPRPWYAQTPETVLLWAPRPGVPDTPFDPAERDSQRARRYWCWGRFSSWTAATAYAYETLGADLVTPWVSRHVLTLDAHQGIPDQGDPVAVHHAQQIQGAAALQAALTALSTLWTAAPIRPGGPWGVFSLSPHGVRRWVRTATGQRLEVPAALVSQPAFQTWCATHAVAIRPE